MDRYLSGQALYGDDFEPEEINQWFQDEAEGFSAVGGHDYDYVHHALNQIHGFRHIKGIHFKSALAIGGARADEYKPISGQVSSITVLEPSDAFSDVCKIGAVPCQYVKPVPSGRMPFKDASFDLITSLGALHHIPNISDIIKECYRISAADCVMLVREPIVSMGDWRKPRRGLTARERGIPLEIMRKIVNRAGFTIMCESLCGFMAIPKIAKKFGSVAYNSLFWTRIDARCCRMLAGNYRYHPVKIYEKFTPTSGFWVLTK